MSLLFVFMVHVCVAAQHTLTGSSLPVWLFSQCVHFLFAAGQPVVALQSSLLAARLLLLLLFR